MGRFFNYDSPLFSSINKIVDCVFLSLLWFVFSIPIVTMGASTSALYYVANKSLRHSRGYIFREFWSGFKSSFKQSTIFWIIAVVIGIVLYVDSVLLDYMLPEGGMLTIAKAFFYAMLLLLILLTLYVLPYIARFELDLKSIVKNCVFMALRHIGWTLLLAVIALVCFFIVFIIPFIAIFFVPAVDALLSSLILEHIFKKYMSKEDLQKVALLNSKSADDH